MVDCESLVKTYVQNPSINVEHWCLRDSLKPIFAASWIIPFLKTQGQGIQSLTDIAPPYQR
jgi:hypothetical protein